MTNKYMFAFSKTGLIRFISHLDTQRLFRRTLKSSGYKIAYSQGFNPTAKIGMAQPLSLGYTGLEEYLEVELFSSDEPSDIVNTLNDNLPDGIHLRWGGFVPENIKSLAAFTDSAIYKIVTPLAEWIINDDNIKSFISQEEILGWRRQKKTKKMVQFSIKDKIRSIVAISNEKSIMAELDCGSNSNLNPEILLKSFLEFMEVSCDLDEVHITREKIIFNKDELNVDF